MSRAKHSLIAVDRWKEGTGTVQGHCLWSLQICVKISKFK